MNRERRPLANKSTIRRSDVVDDKEDKTSKTSVTKKSYSVLKDKIERKEYDIDQQSLDRLENPYNLLSPKDRQDSWHDITLGSRDQQNWNKSKGYERFYTDNPSIYGSMSYKQPKEILNNVQTQLLDEIQQNKKKRLVLKEDISDENQSDKFLYNQATPLSNSENDPEASNGDLIISDDYTNILSNIKRKIDNNKTKFKSIVNKNSIKVPKTYEPDSIEIDPKVTRDKRKIGVRLDHVADERSNKFSDIRMVNRNNTRSNNSIVNMKSLTSTEFNNNLVPKAENEYTHVYERDIELPRHDRHIGSNKQKVRKNRKIASTSHKKDEKNDGWHISKKASMEDNTVSRFKFGELKGSKVSKGGDRDEVASLNSKALRDRIEKFRSNNGFKNRVIKEKLDDHRRTNEAKKLSYKPSINSQIDHGHAFKKNGHALSGNYNERLKFYLQEKAK